MAQNHALSPARREVAHYDYRGADGRLLYQVVRYEPKDFRQRRQFRNSWVWNLDGVPRVLYCLPELLRANPDEFVFVAEGEKDVDVLRRLGLCATTNCMGAGKWLPEYNAHLRGRAVVLLPDNDEPGRKHMDEVARQLFGVADSVRLVQLPGLPPKGDVSDWLQAGGTAEQLLQLAQETRLLGSPPGPSLPAPAAGAAPTRKRGTAGMGLASLIARRAATIGRPSLARRATTAAESRTVISGQGQA